MKKEEALVMLNEQTGGDNPSRVNPSLTETQTLDIMKKGIAGLKDGEELTDLFEKRVYQVCRNQRRPRY